MSRSTATIAVILLLAEAGPLGLWLVQRPVHANPASFTLFGKIAPPNPGWGPSASAINSPGPDVVVMPGESVALSLFSADGNPHTWGIDYDGDNLVDPGEPVSGTFTGSTSYTFTASSFPGNYTYWCSIHYGLMKGKFVVKAPSTPDFTITANPLTVGPLARGINGMSDIAISPMNGFTGTVALSLSASPGLAATVNPSSVSGGSGTSTLTVSSTAPGSFNVNVTGTSGMLSHNVKLTVYIGADFTITPSQTSLSISQGSSSQFDVTLQSQNGFAGTITLSARVIPTSVSASLNPSSLVMSAGSAGSSTVQVSTSSGIYSSTPTGSYTVNITATSGSISHSTTVAITVTSMPSGTGILSTPVIVGVAVAIVAALAITVIVVRRSVRKK